MMSTLEDQANGVILIPLEKMAIVMKSLLSTEPTYLADLTCYEIYPPSEIKGWVVGARLSPATEMY